MWVNEGIVLEIPNFKTWKTALLLSIILPLSLLTSFKLTNLITEPSTIIETKTLEIIEWNFTRPSEQFLVFDKLLQATIQGNDASGNFNLMIFDYVGNVSIMPAEVRMMIEINFTTVNSGAFIYSVSITFHENETLPNVWLPEMDLKFQNLSLEVLNYRRGDDFKAHLRAVGVNHPASIFLSALAHWKLRPINQPHQMEIVYEVVYYNGTAYKKIVQPYHLKLLGSDNIFNI